MHSGFLPLQREIDTAIHTHTTAGSTQGSSLVQTLHDICRESKVSLYCDFDDTLIHPSSLLYSSYRFFYPWKYRNHSVDYKSPTRKSLIIRLAHYVDINPHFAQHYTNTYSHTPIIILTRNNHRLVRDIVSHHIAKWQKNNIPIHGIIGSPCNYIFGSSEKLTILPPNTIFLTDVHERRHVRHDTRAICIEPYSLPRHIIRTGTKTLYALHRLCVL